MPPHRVGPYPQQYLLATIGVALALGLSRLNYQNSLTPSSDFAGGLPEAVWPAEARTLPGGAMLKAPVTCALENISFRTK